MTPSMRLSDIKMLYKEQPDICAALEKAFSLGHEFGIGRAAEVIDRCNREGPYNAIGAAGQIRALRIVEVKPVATIDSDFL